jgi:[NiFe] hydrogenase assembly HybE family chaperone
MHAQNPSMLIEQTFERIHSERMADLPFLNPRISVAAVGFARQGDDWRGVLVTPWGIQLLLLPADCPLERERMGQPRASELASVRRAKT